MKKRLGPPTAALLLLLAGCTGGAASVPIPPAAVVSAPPPAAPDPLAAARGEAVELLGAAGSARAAGDLGIAWELGRQAVAKWPDYAEAKRFVVEVEAQRTAVERERAAAVASYRATVSRRVLAYKDATVDAGAAAVAWRNVPILRFDNDWTKPGPYQDQISRLTFRLAHWQNTAQALAQTTPVPPEGGAVQAQFVAAARETDTLAAEITRAVNARDQAALVGLDARIDRLIRTLAQADAEALRLK